MRAALLVFAYALALAWHLPGPLARLTARGINARLGLAVWLTAMGSVLASAVVAVGILVRAAIAGWPGLAEAVCRSMAGGGCTPAIYRSAAFELGLAAVAVAAALVTIVLAWRYGHGLQQAWRRASAHAAAARITGRRLPGTGVAVPSGARAAARAGAAMVLDDRQPVAYCVAGRPAAIVLTSGALAILDPTQLTAVLAHERAHLAGRHPLLITLARGLSAVFPGVPLFSRGAEEVERLAEMCADDAAARHSGRPALITALLTMGTGTAVPAATLVAGALGAVACAVSERVERLLEPAPAASHARYRAALVSVTLALVTASALVVTLAGPVAAHVPVLG